MFGLLALVAALAQTPDPKTQNGAILSSTPAAAGVFDLKDDGAVRHLQSGLVCPASYPNVGFHGVLVYDSKRGPGTDVGCDYRRADDRGGAWAKLTIFAVKAAPDDTLDAAFARYQGELVQAWPQAVFGGEAVHIERKDKGPSSLPQVRSAEYVTPFNGQTYTTQVYVAITAGWVVEIRTTFVGPPGVVDAGREGPDSAVLETGDRVMGPKALFDALGTIGH